MPFAHRLVRALAVVAIGLVSYGCCCFFNLPPKPTQSVTPAEVTPATEQAVERRAVAGKEAATVGKVTAEVVFFAVAKPKFKSTFGKGEVELDKPELIVSFRFSTSDKTLAAHYVGFNQFLSELTAKDEFGNRLLHTNHSSIYQAVGDSDGNSVRAGEPVTRVLIFEKPLPASKRVDIDMSARCVGQEGTFRFTVPLDAIPERKQAEQK